MSQSTDLQALWDINAVAYDRFCAAHRLYRESSRDLVNLADLRPGMTVVDLGCGTGATTALIVEKLRDVGAVLAVDFSEKMLDFARSRIPSPLVRFIHSPAEEFDQLVEEPVDRVLSNFAFFQFADKEKVLSALGRTIKPGGRFLLNSAAQGFDSLAGAASGLVLETIMEERAAAGLGSAKSANVALVRKELHLDDYGLRIIDSVTRDMMLSVREVLEFYRIPCIGNFLLGLTGIELDQILSAVEHRLEGREDEVVVCRCNVAIIERPS